MYLVNSFQFIINQMFSKAIYFCAFVNFDIFTELFSHFHRIIFTDSRDGLGKNNVQCVCSWPFFAAIYFCEFLFFTKVAKINHLRNN